MRAGIIGLFLIGPPPASIRASFFLGYDSGQESSQTVPGPRCHCRQNPSSSLCRRRSPPFFLFFFFFFFFFFTEAAPSQAPLPPLVDIARPSGDRALCNSPLQLNVTHHVGFSSAPGRRPEPRCRQREPGTAAHGHRLGLAARQEGECAVGGRPVPRPAVRRLGAGLTALRDICRSGKTTGRRATSSTTRRCLRT